MHSMCVSISFSLRGTHKQCAYYSDCWWQIYLSAFYFFPLIKPGEGTPAPQPSCSPSPHTHSSRWVVFSSPACHSPAAVPSATCDSSSTWPPSTPRPNPLQALFPHDCLRTPRNKLGTLVMFLLAPPSRQPQMTISEARTCTEPHIRHT